MSVVCFSSLKGGVGKTSAALNTAHAFAHRGCETLLIDLDPLLAASGFFGFDSKGRRIQDFAEEGEGSPLGVEIDASGSNAVAQSLKVAEVRDNLFLLPVPAMGVGGQDDRKTSSLLWDFAKFLDELSGLYDFIVIDTPPVFSLRTRIPIVASDLVVVPVDCSAMGLASFNCLMEAARAERPDGWGVLRTMVNRRATAVNRTVSDKLDEMFDGSKDGHLFDTHIFRSESFNRLSFLRRTVFDSRGTSALAVPYELLAREIEDVLGHDFNEELGETQEAVPHLRLASG